MLRKAIVAALACLPVPGVAQDSIGGGEVIVTAQRREADGFDASRPAVGLRRRADFALQQVTVSGDTRDADKRHEEIYATARAAVAQAAKQGLQLATGDEVVEPLTMDNVRNLTLKKDSRPDADKAEFFIKVPLTAGVDARAVQARIDAFIKGIPLAGRALIEQTDDLTLSVVRPDQYRPSIVAAVAEDARAMAGRFGDSYAVEARGIERPVEWTRAGLTDVFLYIPYQLTVVPKR